MGTAIILRRAVYVEIVQCVVRQEMLGATAVIIGVVTLIGVEIVLCCLKISARIDPEDCLLGREAAGKIILHLGRLHEGELATVDDLLGIFARLSHVALHPIDACQECLDSVEIEVGLTVVGKLVVM